MELKLRAKNAEGEINTSFNCTIMELKLLELKFDLGLMPLSEQYGFNCTIMELKFEGIRILVACHFAF